MDFRHHSNPYKKTVSDGKDRNAGDRRNRSDRRTICSKGFAYITIVGWICRREQNRRKHERYDSIPEA